MDRLRYLLAPAQRLRDGTSSHRGVQEDIKCKQRVGTLITENASIRFFRHLPEENLRGLTLATPGQMRRFLDLNISSFVFYESF